MFNSEQCCQQKFHQTAAHLPLKPRRQIKAHRDTCSWYFTKPRRTRFSPFFVVKTGLKVAQFCGLAVVLETLQRLLWFIWLSILVAIFETANGMATLRYGDSQGLLGVNIDLQGSLDKIEADNGVCTGLHSCKKIFLAKQWRQSLVLLVLDVSLRWEFSAQWQPLTCRLGIGPTQNTCIWGFSGVVNLACLIISAQFEFCWFFCHKVRKQNKS